MINGKPPLNSGTFYHIFRMVSHVFPMKGARSDSQCAGLYFDHGFDAVTPMHNVSSQIVCDGPGTVLQRGLGSKLAMLHVADTR